MAESTRYGLGDLVDIEQILVEAQHRWLRAAEICEIIRNYKKFRIAPQPAYMPASGSLFLFDRKVLRYFRKDDHNWRKKNDGTTVKEAHERLKVGSIDVLHCYYAYGEENEKFQRRSYWMLEEDLSHIALVHYREVKTSEGKWPLDRDVHMESEQDVNRVNVLYCLELCSAHTDKQENFPMQDNLQGQLSNAEQGYNLDLGKTNINFARKPLLDGPLTEEGLKKPDNFNRWMSKELGDINESHMQSSSGAYWDRVEDIFSQVDLDDYTLGPSVSQDQLFSIIKVLPIWAYEGSEIKVLITGSFLKNQQEAENYAWSCMFGELEVPAEVIADGVLRCYTPIHKAARVPFYVTRSNRLACSEVREFEFRVQHFKDMDITDNYSGNSRKILQMRFGKLLCQSSVCPPNSDYISLSEESLLNNKISSLLKEDGDEWHQMLKLASEKGYSPEKVKEKLLEKLLKEKFHVWLPQKAAEGGKGPSVLDKGGHGVLHFAAALGYNWALKPTILAGVSVNFRDVNGWTALHWAAFCGREHAVAYLGFLGAALDVVTDPSPKYPSGRTPADLASANGHKQIAGDLAESALIAHLSSLKLDTQVPKDLTPHATRVMRETHHDPSLGSLPFGGLITDNPMAVNLPISPGENRVKPLAPFNSKTIQRSATQVAQQQAGPAADAQPADPEAVSSSQLRLQVSQLQLEVSQLRLVVSQVASAFAIEQRRLTEDRRQADRIKTEISDLRAGLLTGVASVGGAGEDFEDALDAFLRGGGGDST